MTSSIQPYGARLISSDFVLNTKRRWYEGKRKLKGSEHKLDVYLRLDDPYSYLMLQVLGSVQQRFNLELDIFIVSEFQQGMYPALDMLKAYAFKDAQALAQLYQLDFPENKPAANLDIMLETKPTAKSVGDDVEKFTRLALATLEENMADHAVIDTVMLDRLLQIFKLFWQKEEASKNGQKNTPIDDMLSNGAYKKLDQQLADNNWRLRQQGHYLAAMIHYGGEWYWGIDRLDHLEQRLIDLGCAHSGNETVQFNRTYSVEVSPSLASYTSNSQTTCSEIKGCEKPLTLFWSARSPYSYLALVRSMKLAREQRIELIIKPVLPMMMRDMFVPDTKKMYIFQDAKREAKKLGIPYGFVADPLGAAVERCYALLNYAEQAGNLNDFLLSFAYAVNSEGIRGETDKGMKIIVQRCGLDWSVAQTLLDKNEWRNTVDENLQEMFDSGCWGVPSMIYDKHVFWGQDRLGLMEQVIVENRLED
jgi:2-hydroxychromene-2-carboxylate isomerase